MDGVRTIGAARPVMLRSDGKAAAVRVEATFLQDMPDEAAADLQRRSRAFCDLTENYVVQIYGTVNLWRRYA